MAGFLVVFAGSDVGVGEAAVHNALVAVAHDSGVPSVGLWP